MALKKGPPDLWLFLIVLFLVGFGIIMVFSASYYDSLLSDPFHYLKKQGAFALVGLLAMIFMMNLPYPIYRPFAKPAVVGVIFLLIAVFFFDDKNGSYRWIPLPGGVNLQPSEVAKFVIALFLADNISKRNFDPNSLKGDAGKSLFVIAIMLGLIYKEPDLGTTVAIACMVGVMLIVAGLKWRYIFSAFIMGILGVAFVIFRTPYQMNRIMGFLDPWSHASGKGYQVINSLYALGSGGFWGMGIGNSRQKLGFLPEQNTDFIFAIIGEELGFIGAGLIIILFLLLAWRGYMIASRCPDTFGCLLAIGIVTSLVVQAGFNLGVVTGSLPVTGIALPFISYGGSSLMTSMGLVGILLNISRYRAS